MSACRVSCGVLVSRGGGGGWTRLRPRKRPRCFPALSWWRYIRLSGMSKAGEQLALMRPQAGCHVPACHPCASTYSLHSSPLPLPPLPPAMLCFPDAFHGFLTFTRASAPGLRLVALSQVPKTPDPYQNALLMLPTDALSVLKVRGSMCMCGHVHTPVCGLTPPPCWSSTLGCGVAYAGTALCETIRVSAHPHMIVLCAAEVRSPCQRQAVCSSAPCL